MTEQAVEDQQAPASVSEEEEVEAAGESVGYYVPEGLPKHFVSERDGRAVVSFQGLIHMLHLATLGEFECVNEPVQQGSKENGNETIVRCTLTGHRRLSGGKEKVPFRVVCYGDASPENVTRMIAVHIRRMAETRAMARAMRVATNVGLTAAEELGPSTNRGRGRSEEPQRYPERVNRGPQRPAPSAPVAQTAEEAPPITEGETHEAVKPVAGIIFRGARRTPEQMVGAMRKRIEALNAAKITDYKRVAEDAPLSEIAAFIDHADKRLKEAADKETPANEAPPAE